MDIFVVNVSVIKLDLNLAYRQCIEKNTDIHKLSPNVQNNHGLN